MTFVLQAKVRTTDQVKTKHISKTASQKFEDKTQAVYRFLFLSHPIWIIF